MPKLRVLPSKSPHSGDTRWRVLDIEEKRFYVFSDGFCIADFIRHTSPPTFQGRWLQYTLAADKGLVYVMCASQRVGEPMQHIVCNPMTKEFHLIPEPKMPHHLNVVVMAVDNAAQRYRIVANIADKSYLTTGIRREEVHLYDSASKLWRVLCQGPDDYRACSSIFLKGVFYTLFADVHGALDFKLFSCDLETGAWSEANVALPRPSHPQDYKSQLVVALGRLFVMKYTGPPVGEILQRTEFRRKFVQNAYINVSIWEIVLGEQDVRRVAEMRKFAKYSYEVVGWNYKEETGDPVVAVGCGSSIVISSWTGRSVRFDLLTKCWYELPFEDLDLLYAGYEHRQGIVASLVDF